MENKVNLQYIHKEENEFSATAIIVSDSDDNRMTIFHPWAMKKASLSKVSYIQEEIDYAIVSANYIPTMLEHMKDLKSYWAKVFADPAQQISQMTSSDLEKFIFSADYLIVNEYEYKEIQNKIWITEKELTEKIDSIVLTLWEKWSQLIQKEKVAYFDAIHVNNIDDTTGAWDAFHPWILKALSEKWGWEVGCKLWTLLASYCIIAPWSQNHHFSFGLVQEDMKKYFGINIDLYNKRQY